MKHFIIGALFYFVGNVAIAQSFVVSGYVKDSLSGETLVGATVYDLKTGKGVVANTFGFYSLSLEKGEVTIQVSYVGYGTKKIDLTLNQNLNLDISLNLKSFEEVIVSSSRVTSLKERIGANSLTIKQIESLPTLLGETDVMKALIMFPGISGGIEGSAGAIVRGGSPDQNLLLLDGATVYNNAHLFGFLSVFNPGAIKNVSVIKGGFPAEFGGRLSSVIDVSMKEGNMQRKQSEWSVGTISSYFVTEGPIKKDTSSYMISGRSSWLGLFLLPTWISYQYNTDGEFYNYFMYDLNAKFNFKTSDKGRLYFSGFHGNDFFVTRTKEADYRNRFKLKWGNTQGNLRYTHSLAPNLYTDFTYHFNQYRYGIQATTMDSNDTLLASMSNNSQIIDHTIKGRLDWLPNKKHKIRFGVEAKALYFKPNYVEQQIEDTYRKGINQPVNASTLAVFLQDNYDVTSFLNIDVGLRWATYLTQNTNYNFLEPRLKITLSDEVQALQVNYSQMNQALHLLTSNGAGLPTDLWLPATALTPPQNAHQFGIGYSRNFLNNQLEATTEVYYKSLSNLIDYQVGGVSFFSTEDDWEDVIERNGIGEAYGCEFLVQKKEGKWNGWAGYTLSWNNRKFENINNGEWFPYRFDRRHDFELTLNYKFSDTWTFASNFVYSTGIAVTLPEAVQTNYFDDGQNYVFTKRNNQRFPAYHRLDLSATKYFETKRGNDAELSFGIYNAYGRKNPFYLSFFISPEISQGMQLNNNLRPTIYGETIFSFLPFVSYKVSF